MLSESSTRKEIIDRRLRDAGWDVADRTQVIEEFAIPAFSYDAGQGTAPETHEQPAAYGPRGFSDYVLLGRNGRPLATLEAKRSSKDAELGREQAKQYCHHIQSRCGCDLPFCFYTNGHDIHFWNLGEAPPQRVHGFPTRQDLERLLYIRAHKKPLTDELINTAIAGRDYQYTVTQLAIRKAKDGRAFPPDDDGFVRTSASGALTQDTKDILEQSLCGYDFDSTGRRKPAAAGSV